jgi:exodeoxyribonuclease VII large subunit
MPRSIYSVSDLTAALRDRVEGEFADIWVEGEVSNLKAAASGHVYFTLKDSSAQLRAVLFKSSLRLIKFTPNNGLRVVARGRLTVYEARGEYQMVVEFLEPAGFGALQLAFEQLKARLEKEGLFDPARKKPLPSLPQRIGLVTSSTGAVISDMIRVLERRFENLHLLLYAVRVQGDEAAGEIVEALKYFNSPPERQVRGPVDVIIVARGGGSLEDLWAFNTEEVARAIAASRIPVISAVGHETDFTIADFVADLRAPTPSAAAEIVVESKAQLHRRVEALRDALEQRVRLLLAAGHRRLETQARHRAFELVRSLLRRRAQQVDDLDRRLRHMDVRVRVQAGRARAAEFAQRLEHEVRIFLEREGGRLDTHAARLRALSPLAVLERGYALVQGPGGVLVRDPAQVAPGDPLDIRVQKGVLKAEVK